MLNKTTLGTMLTLALLATLTLSCSDTTHELDNPGISSPPSLYGENQKQANKIITLSSTQARELNIKTVQVLRQPVSFSINAPGVVYPAPENISIISAPISGRVANIYAHEGETAQKGDPLLELESLDYANLLADFLENTAEATYLKQQLERNRQLVEKEISAQRTLDRAEADYSRAATKVSASKARLKALGVTESLFELWQDEDTEPGSSLIIYSPITGTLNEHLIDLGTSVSANQKMLDIINNQKVLVRGFVSPEDAFLIKKGTPVKITQRSEDNMTTDSRIVNATVTTINPSLDEMNRAIPVNSIINTQNGWPIIGQNVRNEYQITTSESGISIPLSAVQFEQEGAAVFVQINEMSYQKRMITLSRITADEVIVSTGLEEGELVAINQIFSLKALEKFEEFAD